MSNTKKVPGGRTTPKAAPAPAAPPTAALPASPVDDKVKLNSLLTNLEGTRNSRVLVYWLTDLARISEAAILSLYDQLQKIGHQERIDLFLATRGGDTEVPWRIVSLVREYCDHFAVLVPHRATSAGTLLALGADEIVMTPLAALGPIDPSRTHPLLPRREGTAEAEPVSVQDMRHAMQFIREAAGEAAYTPEALAEIFKTLFEKIHPLAIGAIEQSYALSKLIASRCLSTHMSPTESSQIEAIVNRLCDEFKSHSYQIARAEAQEIGLKVVSAPPDVDTAMMELYQFYLRRRVAPAATTKPVMGSTLQAHIAWLDSTVLHLRVVATMQVMDKNGGTQVVGDEWVAY